MYPQQTNANTTPESTIVVGQGGTETPGANSNLQPQVPAGPKHSGLRIVAVLVIVAVIAAVYYVFQLLANNPDRLWADSVKHTDSLALNLATYYGQPRDNGYDYSGNFSNKNSSSVQSGTVTGSTDAHGTSQTTKLSVGGSTVTADVIQKNVANSTNPDVYYRLSGVKALGAIFQGNSNASTFVNSANQIENQWLMIDHATLNNAHAQIPLATSLPLPSVKLQTAAGKINALNEQYLFTSDASKAVLVNRHNVGVDTLNKRAAYHYTFTFNADHYSKYIAALNAALGQTTLSDDSMADMLGLVAIDNGLSTVKQSQTVDVWIDKGTKVIAKVHVPVAGGGNNFVETGIAYADAATLPFYVTSSTSDSGATNVQTSSIGLNGSNNLVYSYKISGTGSGASTTSATTTISARKSALGLTVPAQAANYSSYLPAINTVLSGVSGAQSQ